MNDLHDFVIVDGVLVEYDGDDSEVVIPDGVIGIDEYAFAERTSLMSVTIPSSVTRIGEGVFVECQNLTSITVDNGNPTYHSSGNCLIETKAKKLIQGCDKLTIYAPSGSYAEEYAKKYGIPFKATN